MDNLIQDDEVFPICVPSYKRPNANVFKYIDKIPIVIFIRQEQYAMYEEYKEKCKIIQLNLSTIKI